MANNRRRSITSAFSLEEEFTDGALSSRSFTSRTTQYDDPPIDEEAIAANQEAPGDVEAQDGPDAGDGGDAADNNQNGNGNIGRPNGGDETDQDDDDDNADEGRGGAVIEANSAGPGGNKGCNDVADNNATDNKDNEIDPAEVVDEEKDVDSSVTVGVGKDSADVDEDEADLGEIEAPQAFTQMVTPVATLTATLERVYPSAGAGVTEPAPSPDDLSPYEDSDHDLDEDGPHDIAHVDKKPRTE